MEQKENKKRKDNKESIRRLKHRTGNRGGDADKTNFFEI